MMPRRVWFAILIAFFCHGLFIVTARYRLSYDAYTHMLFANHYAENWFSLWETRWYTGFTVVSYPPLVHQLIALFIPLLGFDKAYALILWIITSLYPLGIYAFSRIFTGKTSASYAALASAILLPIYVTAYNFGQLPFLTSTLLALFSAASLNRYLREGGTHNLLLTITLYATTMAAHHATLLVQPFLILAVIANRFYRRDNTAQRLKILPRLMIFAIFTAFTSFLIIFPFWQWGASQSMQIPIDHLSRHNFFTDPLALVVFFFPLYGPLIAVMPFLFCKWQPRFIGLRFSFGVLFLLGLGDTTPLPHLFFGNNWEWLTYDRFAFWASLTLTPFFGMLFIQLKRRWKNRLITKPVAVTLRRSFFSTAIFSFFAVTVLGAWFTPLIFPLQPKTIEMQPIVDFLNAGNHSQYRYLTFGFGDQFAHLNLLTKATTIDGSYHTARTLPELRTSGIGQIDTAYWALNGMNAIIPILQQSSEHGVRWGFVNPAIVETIIIHGEKIHRNPYIPVLEQLGWIKINILKNGVIVYENPNAVMPIPSTPPNTKPITSFVWGVFPLLAFVTSLTLGTLRIWHIEAERVIRSLYSLLVGLIPISLCFWIYQTIGDFSHPRVYFTYDNALFFISDALAVLAIILWLSAKISQSTNFILQASSLTSQRLLIALFLLSSFSIFWSQDWRVSLYISLHFWLVFLLILSLRDWHQVWKIAMFGLCAALSIQLIMGFIGYALQSTAFIDPLVMKWPGALDPSIRGASVVQLANGLRILRAYGTLPHPNILAGFVLITLLGPASLYLENKSRNYPALILFSMGILLIGLTFSRSAWLGLFAFIAILILKSKHFNRKQLFLLVSTSLLTIALTLYFLRNLIFTRINSAQVSTEQISTVGREWLTQQALDMFRAHQLTGVGIGSFILSLSKHVVEGAPIEPVHNIFLLAVAELGIVGLLLMVVLFISSALNISKAQTPKAILASATLTGLGVISLFDHYLWTLAPGRIMLGLALGLWIGQIVNDA